MYSKHKHGLYLVIQTWEEKNSCVVTMKDTVLSEPSVHI